MSVIKCWSHVGFSSIKDKSCDHPSLITNMALILRAVRAIWCKILELGEFLNEAE